MPSCVILVGTDFSPGALAALAHARGLAPALAAEMQVIHVVEPSLDERTPADAAAWCRDAELDPGLLVTRVGHPWLELARAAQAAGAALLVVGTHGRSGFQPVELGSTASRVGLVSPCPILLVGCRQGSPTQPFEMSRQSFALQP